MEEEVSPGANAARPEPIGLFPISLTVVRYSVVILFFVPIVFLASRYVMIDESWPGWSDFAALFTMYSAFVLGIFVVWRHALDRYDTEDLGIVRTSSGGFLVACYIPLYNFMWLALCCYTVNRLMSSELARKFPPFNPNGIGVWEFVLRPVLIPLIVLPVFYPWLPMALIAIIIVVAARPYRGRCSLNYSRNWHYVPDPTSVFVSILEVPLVAALLYILIKGGIIADTFSVTLLASYFLMEWYGVFVAMILFFEKETEVHPK